MSIDTDPLAAWDAAVGAAGRPVTTPPARKVALSRHSEADKQRPEAMYLFFDERGITGETVDKLGVYAHPWFFPGDAEPQLALVFPTRRAGVDVIRAYRYRARDAYDFEAGTDTALFNGDAIETPDHIWWTDSPMAVAAMVESGFPQTVALPGDTTDDRQFQAMDAHAETLGAAQRFYLATAADEAGTALREELARRLGRHRCWIVAWPEGCAGAEETLLKHGPEGVQAAVAAAEPYPIQGVQTIRENTLMDLRRRAPPAVMGSGCGAADDAVKYPTEGRVIIVTGIPGSGKSVFVRFAMVHQMEKYARRWAVFSPEMEPWQEFVAACAEVLHGKQFWPDPKFPMMPTLSEDEIRHATAWFAPRLFMLTSDSEEEAPTLDWWMEATRALILRHGITDALIDPWNEMDHVRGGSTMAEYISRSLQKLNAFARRHGVNVWIVNHPHSMKPVKAGDPVQPPGLYDMDGGAAWANKGALILTVHRPANSQETQLIVRKSKFRRFGRRGAEAMMSFDVSTGRYSTPVV
ncbi:MAG: hypothetical protein ACEQSH_00410 [Bacteroidia bacterium]